MDGGNVIEYNCQKCSLADTMRMVQCDSCDKWFHFECVSVNSDVESLSWICDSCNQHQPMVLNNTRGQNDQGEGIINSSPPGQRVIFDPPPKNVMIVTQATSLATAADTANASAYTKAPTSAMNTNVTFYNYNPVVTATSSTKASAYKEALAPRGVALNTSNSNTMGQPTYVTSWSTPAQNPLLCSTSINTSQMPTVNPTSGQRDLLLQMLEEEKELQRKYLEKKYQILSQTEGDVAMNNLSLNTQTNQPTSAQLAARQVIPKDLPAFDGNPEDWPLFISSFRNSTEIAGYTDAENLMRLQSCVKGKAKELIRSKLFLPSMVPEILQTLEMCYGRPEHILESLIEKARKFPPPKERLENFIEFALMVRNLCSTMEACSMGAHLNNPMLVKEFVDKLPNNQKLNWAMHGKDANIPVVKAFSDWIYNIAIAASQVVSPLNHKRSASMNTHTTDTTENKKYLCVVCGSNEHKIQSCDEFRNMPLDGKWSLVTSKKLCRQCLNIHRRKCYLNKVCGINNCAAKHHQLLHKDIHQDNNTEQSADNESSNTVNAHADTRGDFRPFFRFVPVRLYAKSKTFETFAFLDEGSSVTLMEHEIFERLHLDGVKEPLTLRWTGQTTREEEESVKLAMTISGTNSNTKFTLNDVHTVKHLGLPTQSVDVEELIKGNSYLKGLPIKSYRNVTPGILIGVNNWKLAVPLKVREGDWHQPIASKTRLGWTLQGPSQNSVDVPTVNVHTCDCEKQYQDLHNQVKNYFSLEAPSAKKILSSDDQKVFKILEDTCQKKEGQYEIGLLWRNENVHLPDSYNLALNRLKCLQKKFKDTNLRSIMQTEIEKLVSKGYARKLSRAEMESCSNPVWYLPIFIARNPNKPEKIRLVWDAASKANGVSLNDFMMSGPDLLRPLFEILVDFRVGKIAICGDISEMFHRINVRDEDMHVQRFLWHDDTSNQSPSVYVMKALTFGISCAPCIAHFVRDKNADMFINKYPRAVKSIKCYHYMDDFIDSVDTEEEALQLATEVKIIHASAGFKMHNWTSNSARLQYDMGSDDANKQPSVTMGSVEKILGMYWDPNKDTFKYICRFARLQRDVFSDNNIPTKREVLQVLMSIFDPLGFVSIYTIGLKILLQEIWRSKINWDDELSAELYQKWRQWTQNLAYITQVTIPRCYSPLLSTSDHIELHTFVDAGEFAYAAVCYLLVKHNSEINISLVAAKSKVAPLKPVSIPRMELQAAVIGVRLAAKILSGIRVNINNSFWWTDSKTVLSWLYMDPRNFKQFVMHRVGEILETTNTSQWKWVPSKSNPADAATKTSKPNIQQWFNGPEFLRGEKDDWPICSTPGKTDDDSELRHGVYHIWQEKPIINFTYFSCWRRLYRALATFILYTERLKAISRKNTPPCEVDFEMLQKSKNVLYKTAQQTEFVTEIADLKQGHPVSKHSKLKQLNPFIDADGILRGKGRVESLSCNMPIILPYNHHVTFLVVRYYHELNHHCFHETTINNIRSRFYIPRLRVIYKTVRGKCQRCKNYLCSPVMPQMAPLPCFRLASFERPFTFVGIDFFGPYLVVVGRRNEKRWGVVFTCLTVRAVHIEVSHSLDTSSCIMCIANFIHRRGMPKEIFTDNGTNFKGAAKVLKEEQKQLNLQQMAGKFDEIKWTFNPPAAPHMGGAWERMVKSIKSVLKVTYPNFKFNDESFRNALWEAEFIINSRPLTFVSLEAEDDEPLTPNHLLLGSSSGYKPICSNNDLRDRWRQTQKFADHFWRRWVKEYAPDLLRRGKWFNKQPPASVGDIVILVDENFPRNTWPKGTIIETTTAKDGQVRRVKIKTSTGILERPISKVAILDVGAKSESKLTSS